MKTKTDIRFESRARIIKAIVYAKRIFVVIEMFEGKKHHVMELAGDQDKTKSTIIRGILRDSATLTKGQPMSGS